MKTQELEEQLKKAYSRRLRSTKKRVQKALEKASIDLNALEEESSLKSVATTLIEEETKKLKSELDTLLAKKEAIERELEKKSEELQELKYEVFNALEECIEPQSPTLVKLHHVKLQSIDLYDILSEMVESALITALEKDTDGDILEYTTELIKEITYESIKEGSLNTIRVRKILSTILATAIEVSEATPNRAQDILSATLKGMRSGLIKSIDRFKKRIAFMPVEAKHILIEDYDTIIEDLNQTDTLFSQVIITQASESSTTIRSMLIELNKEMRYDLEELILISKETAEVIKERFSSLAKIAAKKADVALKSTRAQEAKRMGIQAFGVVQEAFGTALKSAKEAIDKKES
jgi:hypothetical protein